MKQLLKIALGLVLCLEGSPLATTTKMLLSADSA